ncbi:type II toxin-antitoxin system HicB family antitoxin [Candidatus Poribacteria bacterium]|nr:type II toxin-antitoxin system HicB family antitoxin [Candidatus Poribacteria bacterium]
MHYLVIFEHGDMNYSAYVPDLPVCVAVGDTLEETRQEIAEVMKFHVECLQEDGEVIPKLTSKMAEHTSSGVISEFVEIELDSPSIIKHSNFPFLSSIMSRIKRKRV